MMGILSTEVLKPCQWTFWIPSDLDDIRTRHRMLDVLFPVSAQYIW